MRVKRKDIAQSVADRLFAAETALDLAAARIAELNAALPLARLDAVTSSAAAMVLVARTREEIVATHANLKRASEDMGLREVSYGDLFKAGVAQQRTPEPHLRAV